MPTIFEKLKKFAEDLQAYENRSRESMTRALWTTSFNDAQISLLRRHFSDSAQHSFEERLIDKNLGGAYATRYTLLYCFTDFLSKDTSSFSIDHTIDQPLPVSLLLEQCYSLELHMRDIIHNYRLIIGSNEEAEKFVDRLENTMLPKLQKITVQLERESGLKKEEMDAVRGNAVKKLMEGTEHVSFIPDAEWQAAKGPA